MKKLWDIEPYKLVIVFFYIYKMKRNLVNQSNDDNILGIPFQNLPTSNDQIIIYQIDNSGNGYFVFGNISTAGGINVVNSSGSGASIINSVVGGTLTLKSILSTTPNIGINNLSNQLELTLGPNLTNIFSITNVNPIEILPGVKAFQYELEPKPGGTGPTGTYDFMLYEAADDFTGHSGYYFSINDSGSDTDREILFESVRSGVKKYPMRIDNSGNIFMSLPSITPLYTVGIDTSGQIGTFTTATGMLTAIQNVGNGAGQIWESTSGGIANLRTINAGNNIGVSTTVDTVNISLNTNLTGIVSIAGGNLAINAPNITFPSILNVTTPTYYLGLNGTNLSYFTPPPSTALSVASSGTGSPIYKSYASNLLTLKTLAVGNSLGITDDTNTLTVALSPTISVTNINSTGNISVTPTGNLTLNTTNIFTPTLGGTSNVVTALVQDSTNKIFASPIKTVFNNIGGGTPIYDTTSSTNNALNFNTLTAGGSILLNSGGGLVSIAVSSTMANMQIVNSGSGFTQFNNTVRLQSATTVTSPPFYLSLDSSNNITKTTLPPSTNIYNSNGALTALTRTVSSFDLSTNNKIVYDNVYTSLINSIKYNPTYLGTMQLGVESAFERFYDSAGDSWGKYECTNYENRVVSIPALGASGNYNTFYVSRADGTLQNSVWILKVFLFENSPTNNSAYIGVFDITMNAPNNNFNYQSVYPKWCTNNQPYLLEVGQALSTNQFTLFIRVRNFGSATMNQTLTAKIESYARADKAVTTPMSTGNLAINTVGSTFPMSIPIIGQFNSSTNAGATLTSILWAYNNFPRQVKIVYQISAQSVTAGLNVIFQFTNNGVNLFQRVFRTGTNNTFTDIAGSWLIDVPVALATGSLLMGTNTFAATATTNPTAITLLNQTYCVNFEFLN